MIYINETKLDGSILSNEVATDGYRLIKIDRSRKRGRVACYLYHQLLRRLLSQQ